MHRQSLGSPSPKLVRDHEHLSSAENQLKQFPSSQPSSSSISNTLGGNLFFGEECKEKEDELKKLKKLKPKATMPESYIHLIPMLTLLCFLILYLSSHSPSQTDLAQFNGLKSFSFPADTVDNNISELEQIVEIKKGDMLAIRSLKNLKQEAGTAKYRRLHRKFAHF